MEPLSVVLSHDIFSGRQGGALRLYNELCRELSERGTQTTVVAPLYCSDRPPSRVIGLRYPFERGCRFVRSFNEVLSPSIVARVIHRFPRVVFHRTYYSPRPPPPIPSVVTVLDMIHERHLASLPSAAKLAAAKRASCSSADVVIAISEYTRGQVIDMLGIEPWRVVVAPLGVRSIPADKPTLTLLRRGRPFGLFVGGREGYKNFTAFAEAFRQSAAYRCGLGLVAFGGGAWSEGELQRMRALGLADRALHASGNDHLLWAYYSAAQFLCYPSLDEGFGLPPLEAMTAGCPVLATSGGAVPDVVGDAAVLFDAHDVASIASAIDFVLDTKNVATLRERGFAKARAYQWGDTANAVLDAYKQAIALHNDDMPAA